MLYSRYNMETREGEKFISEHIFAYLITGTTHIHDDESREYVFREGEFIFYKRNHLVKFIKQPPAGDDFRAVSVTFDQAALRQQQ